MKWVSCLKMAIMVCAFLPGLKLSSQQLVMPGDYPDPSVVKIGDTYWASATTSNWMPAYPLLKSKDLVHWQFAGNVFEKKPDWVDYYFWAPEISYDNGKVYIYYSAHKRDGNLCVGIASADRPEGPYKDHGPLICQPVGSIDAFPIRDENGKLHLVWKEDANSVNKPTPIWIQEINEERTAMVGEKKELFRNDKPWEGNLVEGVSMIKRGEYIYAFYAAAGCCGAGCTYKTGVARAKSIMGPWEKYDKNPVLANTDEWMCQGHGTPVEMAGKYYFLYHAYDKRSNVYVGRQGMLIEFIFTPDGWIEFVQQDKPDVAATKRVKDEFWGRRLSKDWQWSVFHDIRAKKGWGRLSLYALPTATGAFLGQKTYTLDYDAEAEVKKRKSNAAAGIAAIGDERNIVGAYIKGDSVKVVQVKDGKETAVASQIKTDRRSGYLRMQVRNGKEITFLYSGNGKDFSVLNTTPVDGSYLPPWDRAVRVGIISKGVEGSRAVFDDFTVDFK